MKRPRPVREAVALDHAGSGARLSSAAAAAGYKYPSQAAAQLLGRPEFRDALIDRLQERAVRWTHLLGLGLDRLLDFLSPAAVVCSHLCECGRRCGATVWVPPPLRPADTLYAVKITMDTILRAGMGASLRDRAKAEDEGDVRSVAARMLGNRPGVGGLSVSNGPDDKPVQ